MLQSKPIWGGGILETALCFLLCLCLATQTLQAQTCNSQTNPCQGTDFYSQIQCSISQNNVNTANLTSLQQLFSGAAQQIATLNAQIATLQQQTIDENINNVIANHPTKINKRQAVPPNINPVYSYDSLNPQLCVCQEPTCFQGVWKRLTFGNGPMVRAVGGGAIPGGTANGMLTGGHYISLTVSNINGTNYVFATSTAGSPKYPRSFTPGYDAPTTLFTPFTPGVADNQYVFQTPTQLVNAYQATFPTSTPAASQILAATFNLINNCTMVQSNTAYANLGQGSLGGLDLNIYERISEMPAMANQIDWTDKLNLFDAVVDMYQTTLIARSPQSGDLDYLGPELEDKIYSQMTSGGFTTTTPVRLIRVTNTLNYASFVTNLLTTLYTGDPFTNEGMHAFCPPGSDITLQGFPTSWPVNVNGFIHNAVPVVQASSIPNLNARFVDSGPGGSVANSTMSFLARLDTRTLQSMADLNGFVRVPVGATVTCTHLVTPNMSYPAFVAAIFAYYQATFQTATHPNLRVYTNATNSWFVAESSDRNWSQLAQWIKAGGVQFSYMFRTNSMFPNMWMHANFPTASTTTSTFYSATKAVNVPFPISPAVNPLIMSQNIDVLNYLVNVKTLLWSLQGTLDPDQLNPATAFSAWYTPIAGPGRMHFVGQLVNSTVVGGTVSVASIPAGWRTYGANFGTTTPTIATANALNANQYYFGQINSSYTGGKTICYMRMSADTSDPNHVMGTGFYNLDPPQSTTNPRQARESLSAVLSPLLQYFNSIGCQAYIYNNVFNQGGTGNEVIALMEFFGDNRRMARIRAAPLSQTTVGPIRLTDTVNYPTVNNVTGLTEQAFGYMYSQLNAQKYPGSLIQGTPTNPIPLILLTDMHALSAADSTVPISVGSELNGHIGGNVYVKLVGCVDGRLKGFPIASPSLVPQMLDPNNNYASLFNTSAGAPTFPFRLTMDLAALQIFSYGTKEISGLTQSSFSVPHRTTWTGASGGPALPIDLESVALQGMGYNPISLVQHPPLAGWTKGSTGAGIPDTFDITTWRYLYLEESILVASESLTTIASNA